MEEDDRNRLNNNWQKRLKNMKNESCFQNKLAALKMIYLRD